MTSARISDALETSAEPERRLPDPTAATLRPPGWAPVAGRSAGETAFSAATILVYCALAVIAYWPAWPLSHYLFGRSADYLQSVWFVAWVPHALAHGQNPLFSGAMDAPGGLNLGANTASPLFGLAGALFAPVLSPLARTNLFMVAAMPASATTAFLVLRRWSVWTPAAAVGGLIYGFSPYMVWQSLAHVELLFVPLPPLIALTLTSIWQQTGSPRRLGLQLGLLLAGQYLISPEIFASVVIFAILGLAFAMARDPRAAPARARAMARPITIAVAALVALIAFPVWMLLAGPAHTSGPPFSTSNSLHNDLLSFVAPTRLQRISLGLRSVGNRLVSRNPLVESGFVGIPVLLLTAALLGRSRRSLRMQLAGVLLLCAMVLSLGPHLSVDGRVSSIPLPFLLLDHLPLLSDLLPMRFSFEMGAGLAAVIAFGLDDLHRRTAGPWRAGVLRRRTGVIAVGATLVVVVGTQLPLWPLPTPPSPGPAFPAALQRHVPAGDPLTLTYPYAVAQEAVESMQWQVEDGFRFRLLGGYGHHPEGPSATPDPWPSAMSPPELQRFLAGQEGVLLYGRPLVVTDHLARASLAALARNHVRLVIVDRSMPGSAPVVALFQEALGPPKVSIGQFSVWTGWRTTPSTFVPKPGYWLLAADGRVYSFGAPALGSRTVQCVVGENCAAGIAPTPDGGGYSVLFEDAFGSASSATGNIASFGEATAPSKRCTIYLSGHFVPSYDQPVRWTAVAASPATSGGYWLIGPKDLAACGGVSLLGVPPPSSVGTWSGIASTPDGKGYWIATADGMVYPFGSARAFGSMAGHHLNGPVDGIVPTADGQGYWLVAADGGVFAFGDAPFSGSTGALPYSSPIVGLADDPDGTGYWTVAQNGKVFDFGAAPRRGSVTGSPTPIVGIAS